MPSHNARTANNSLSPMALSILGLEQAGFLPSGSQDRRPGRSRSGHGHGSSERRVTSYYNHFSSRTAVSHDGPPTYSSVLRDSKFRPSPRYLDNGNEVLPRYTCTVFKQGPMQMRLESCSPFLILPFQEWRSVYVLVQGTMLCIYKLKTQQIEKVQVHSAGKLLRKYTLQHAEVGVAPDITHSVLVPTSRLASLIPPLARKKAHERDPELFKVERHFALRIRSELDQLVLTNPAEEQVMAWVNHISAAIDIAPAIDERSIPRQCTMPRRRRRQPERIINTTDLTDQRLIEEQRRILARYPALADDPTATRNASEASANPATQAGQDITAPSRVQVAAALPEQEAEDIDLSEIAEESPTTCSSRRPTSTSSARSLTRPSTSRANSANLVSMSAFLSRSNFDATTGKWAPLHPRTAAQQWRYIRRCMPVLLAETPRHSSVMITEGRYIRPNYKMDVLEEWTLSPPPYEAHNFPINAAALRRNNTVTFQSRIKRPSFSSEGSVRNGSESESESANAVRRVDSSNTAGELAAVAFAETSLGLDFKNFGAERPGLGARGLTKGSTGARGEEGREMEITVLGY